MPTDIDSVIITAQIPVWVRDELQRIAKSDERTFSFVVRKTLENRARRTMPKAKKQKVASA